jgi:hypothetical protein
MQALKKFALAAAATALATAPAVGLIAAPAGGGQGELLQRLHGAPFLLSSRRHACGY